MTSSEQHIPVRALEAAVLREAIDELEREQLAGESVPTLQAALDRASVSGALPERVRRAIAVAARGHATQTTVDGGPYVLHPLHLVCQVAHLGEDRMLVAALHDYFEDCDVDEGAVSFLTADERDALERLTHDDGSEYLGAYLERIIESPLARDVKAADLTHNLDLSRRDLDQPFDQKVLDRANKYREALRRIRAASAETADVN
jgi:hypothetical protein